MAYTIALTKRTNGGYTIVADGVTSYASELKYHGTTDGVILLAEMLRLTRFYRPAEWTIAGVATYTAVTQVCDAMDALGVLSSDTLEDIEAILTTIDGDTGNIVADVSAIKTALEIMDDWDESDRAKVNIIAGQTGVDGGAGKPTLKTQRTLVAKADYVDTTSATVIYEGYSNGTNYDICKIDLSTAVISRIWATGTWEGRVALFQL